MPSYVIGNDFEKLEEFSPATDQDTGDELKVSRNTRLFTAELERILYDRMEC